MQHQMGPLNFAVRGAVYIAERLFSSSLVAVVARDDPRTLRVCHFNKGTEITSRKFDTKILSVKLNREVHSRSRYSISTIASLFRLQFPTLQLSEDIQTAMNEF